MYDLILVLGCVKPTNDKENGADDLDTHLIIEVNIIYDNWDSLRLEWDSSLLKVQ